MRETLSRARVVGNPKPRVRTHWELDCVYLDTASYGLPPRPAWQALQEALAGWRGGSASSVPWDDATERSRELFARLVGADVDRVAIGSGVSPFAGLIAAALPKARVLAADIEFSSLLWPWLAWDCDVKMAPLSRLADFVDETTDAVLVSAVQSVTGEVADLDAVTAAARAHGAFVVVDATQGCGWLPLEAGRFDALISSAYKWLLAPRGSAFLAIGDALLERVAPILANWYAPDGVGGSYYGLPMPSSDRATRLDLSPAWFSWVGTAPALEALLEVGIDAIYEHDLALANRFRAGLGLSESNSAIVTADLPDRDAGLRLERAGVRALARDGRLRAGFHLYNNEADVDEALTALIG